MAPSQPRRRMIRSLASLRSIRLAFVVAATAVPAAASSFSPSSTVATVVEGAVRRRLRAPSYSAVACTPPAFQFPARRCAAPALRPSTFSPFLRRRNPTPPSYPALRASADDDPNSAPDPFAPYTHQIAIPLSESDELIECLRAVQTSLVRDCPRLIRGCIVPAVLRLPLLYVDASTLSFGTNAGLGNDAATIVIGNAVDRAIREVVYGEGGVDAGNGNGGADGGADLNLDSKSAGRPILIPFTGLELEGKDNSILYAVGVSDEDRASASSQDDEEDGVYVVDEWGQRDSVDAESGATLLGRLTERIRRELEDAHGLATRYPSDDPQAGSGPVQKPWRPRVPFMRLPPDFYDGLDLFGEDGGDDEGSLNIDGGADGISPLFWYEEWSERDVLRPPGARMRSVAVYRRTADGGGESENSFYVPTSNSMSASIDGGVEGGDRTPLDLPVGDDRTTARERREMAVAMQRMSKEERKAEEDWEAAKAQMERDMFGASPSSATAPSDDVGSVTVDESAAYALADDTAREDAPVQRTIDVSASAVTDSVAGGGDGATTTEEGGEGNTAGERTPPEKKDLPTVEDNPIFQRLWEGKSQIDSRGRSGAARLDSPAGGDDPAPETLPPYPSDPHFVGVWRVVSSPLDGGPSDVSTSTMAATPEEKNVLGLGGTGSTAEDVASASSCDNLVLRVDGGTMGGPVLDAANNQKAAGGTWKMFRAVRKRGAADVEDDASRPPLESQTRLRVRLLVPPEKRQCLVMEGEVSRMVMPRAGVAGESVGGDSTGNGGVQLASSAVPFGVDFARNTGAGDDDKKISSPSTGDGGGNDALLYCGGEAWLEDADGGGNRKKLGPFSLMKLKTFDRSRLIYTVPASKIGGPKDEEEEDFQ